MEWLGEAGGIARGIVFLTAGIFLVVAIGLIMFGLFPCCEAKWVRR